VNYRGYDIFELPPNGQGIATLQILNILEGFDLRAMGRNSPETLHTMIEAKKIAWADRRSFMRSGFCEDSSGRASLETIRRRAPEID
jgi:Gamma-glutamyltransferase